MLFFSPLSTDASAKVLKGPEVLAEAYLMHKADSSFAGLLELRQSVDAAFDRNVALKFALLDLIDPGRAAKKFLPEGLSPRFSLATSYNPTQAKLLMKSATAKAKAPSEIDIVYQESQSGHKGLAEQLREFLAEIDAPKAREVPLDNASFQSKIKKEDFSIAVFHFSPVAPKGLAVPNLLAAIGEHTEAFDFVAKGSHLSESALKKREEALSGQVLMISHRAPTLLYDARLKGFGFNEIGALDFSRVWLEP
jgi:MarR-like DNA-binding transcriptional regulator SgrR of sgrS sRNA